MIKSSLDKQKESIKALAVGAAKALEEGVARNVTVLHVEGLTLLGDYFVIASGATARHVKALADRVVGTLKPTRKPKHVEGYNAGAWILIDYGDVIVHVFKEEERSFYGLERLWGDAPTLLGSWSEPETPPVEEGLD